MYKTLGLINIGLIVLITSPYWLRMLNTKLLHSKAPWLGKLLGVLRPLHKILAVVLLVLIGVHGTLALGGLRLHTGTVAAVGFLITALLGLVFFLLHKSGFLKAHRIAALVSVLLVAVHLLVPNLLSGFAR